MKPWIGTSTKWIIGGMVRAMNEADDEKRKPHWRKNPHGAYRAITDLIGAAIVLWTVWYFDFYGYCETAVKWVFITTGWGWTH